LEPFEPGQFVQIGLPSPEAPSGERVRVNKRSYSIASGARELERVELYVNRVDDGRFTPRLWNLHVGERVWLGVWLDRRPRGLFTLGAVPASARLLLVATGTGLAPYISMVRTWSGTERWSRALVVHGARTPDELGYRELLEQRARTDAAFGYVPIVSRPRSEHAWTGLRGRVQLALDPERFRELAGEELEPGPWHVFLCGNPAMVEECRASLEARGFRANKASQPGTLHFEKYW
jgi:ferredoxin--NADP+ reductase